MPFESAHHMVRCSQAHIPEVALKTKIAQQFCKASNQEKLQYPYITEQGKGMQGTLHSLSMYPVRSQCLTLSF